jgi:hypothetical protein
MAILEFVDYDMLVEKKKEEQKKTKEKKNKEA